MFDDLDKAGKTKNYFLSVHEYDDGSKVIYKLKLYQCLVNRYEDSADLLGNKYTLSPDSSILIKRLLNRLCSSSATQSIQRKFDGWQSSTYFKIFYCQICS